MRTGVATPAIHAPAGAAAAPLAGRGAGGTVWTGVPGRVVSEVHGRLEGVCLPVAGQTSTRH